MIWTISQSTSRCIKLQQDFHLGFAVQICSSITFVVTLTRKNYVSKIMYALPITPRRIIPGLWYVISHIPTPFEKTSFGATEEYTWTDKPSGRFRWIHELLDIYTPLFRAPLISLPPLIHPLLLCGRVEFKYRAKHLKGRESIMHQKGKS